MGYSYSNTIISWVEDKALLALINKTAKELKLNLLEVQVETDILGLPYFFAIIYGGNLNKKVLADLKEIISWEKPKEFAILLTSTSASKIPPAIKKYFLKPQEIINPAWLRTTILNKKIAISRHKDNKRSYDKTIFRTVSILRKLMRKNTVLKLDELCNEYGVSEKTIKRDFDLLNSMGEDIAYDKQKQGYVLLFSVNGFIDEK